MSTLTDRSGHQLRTPGRRSLTRVQANHLIELVIATRAAARAVATTHGDANRVSADDASFDTILTAIMELTA